MNNNEKKFNPSLCRGYMTRQGNYMSPVINSADYDAIIANIKIGGKLVLRKTKTRKNENSPDAYFDFISPEEVQKFQAEQALKKGSTTTPDNTSNNDQDL